MHASSDLTPDFSTVRGSRLLIALSGGADSVALAVLLSESREACGLNLAAAHLDHGIRAESAEDAEFCRALCRTLNLPFYSRRIDVPREAARTGEGLETVARRLRYQWLREIRAEIGAKWIALAHHLDDQAETVLMHLARGAGPEGIAGMRPVSGDLYRPLLDYRKQELVCFLKSRGIAWREDRTNADDDTPRNALRLHVLPALEQGYPQFARAVARYARIAQTESDYVAEQTGIYMAAHRVTGPFGEWLDLSCVPPMALFRRAIRTLCGSDLALETIERIEALCRAGKGRLDIPGRFSVERCGRGVYFVPKSAPQAAEAVFAQNGTARLPGICSVSASPCAAVPVRDNPMRQALNAEALRGAVLRTRREGDRFRPLGCGDRKLSDYLIDRRIDRPLRDSVALLAVENRVMWVCGMGISEDARLRSPEDRALALECRYEYPFTEMTGPVNTPNEG